LRILTQKDHANFVAAQVSKRCRCSVAAALGRNNKVCRESAYCVKRETIHLQLLLMQDRAAAEGLRA
jgi:hypothetical protein